MGVVKRSVSIDDETAAAIERAANEEHTTFSTWLTQAAQRQLRIREGLRAVAEYEAEVGEITDEEMAAARRRRERLKRQDPAETTPTMNLAAIRRWAQENGYHLKRNGASA